MNLVSLRTSGTRGCLAGDEIDDLGSRGLPRFSGPEKGIVEDRTPWARIRYVQRSLGGTPDAPTPAQLSYLEQARIEPKITSKEDHALQAWHPAA